MKLLIVEDEEDLAYFIQKGLQRSGYLTDIAKDGEEALYMAESGSYDCILLDLNLPKMDGLEVLRRIRVKDEFTKILILSARTKVEERVEGLDLGANDYMCKPFDFLELEARIRTLLRISYVQKSTIYRCGDLSLNMKSHEITYQGHPVFFTRKESMILEYLFMHQGQVISQEKLIEQCWDDDADLFSNALKFHLHSIKKKLEKEDPIHEYIKNVRGRGYMMLEVPNETNE